MSARKPRIVRPRRPSRREDADVRSRPADFSDPESQRVLTVAARAVARELGREAGREYFAEWIRMRFRP